MAADVDERAPPGKARLIFDGDGGGGESGGRDGDELKKSLQAADCAERGWRREGRAGVADGEFVGFIFAESLYCRAGVVRVDLQRGHRAGLGAEWNSGLAGKLGLESLNFFVEGRVVRAADGNRE